LRWLMVAKRAHDIYPPKVGYAVTIADVLDKYYFIMRDTLLPNLDAERAVQLLLSNPIRHCHLFIPLSLSGELDTLTDGWVTSL
jgi:hypothetical protein